MAENTMDFSRFKTISGNDHQQHDFYYACSEYLFSNAFCPI